VAISPAAGWELGAPEGERLARFFSRLIRVARFTAPRADTLLRTSMARRMGFRDTMRHGERMTPREAADLVRATARFALVDELMYALRHEDASLPKELDRVEAPVLLAWAERDRIVPASTCSSRYRREIPGAEFRLLPRTGHVPMWDDPDLIVETVVDWVMRH
jgi:pimeloyl-ACP methyl ester carboxylesterase